MRCRRSGRVATLAALGGVLFLLSPARAADDDPGSGAEVSSAGYVEMPQATDGSYTLASGVGSGRHWGKPETIRFLVFAAKEWRRRHPEAPRFHIGDLSRPDGADFPPHKTHKDGCSIDLFTRAKNVCHVGYPDQDLTQELAEMLVSLGARQILYNGEQVIKAVKEVEPWEKHDDHFHVVVDPKRVPKDLAPLLVADRSAKDGAFIGADGFGAPRARARRPKKGEDPSAPRPELRLAWDYLGEARGLQAKARVVVEPAAGQKGPRLDTGWEENPRPYILLPEEVGHGTKLRWRAFVEWRDGTKQELPWQSVTVDLQPPGLEAAAPLGDGAARTPTFRWTYEDLSPQRTARVELRRAGSRRGAQVGVVEGEGLEVPCEAALPKGALEWRVVATDAAGNEGASEWAAFRVE